MSKQFNFTYELFDSSDELTSQDAFLLSEARSVTQFAYAPYSGFQVGAFATKTNVSAKDFGEGSFDKGIMLEIPLSWFSGKPSRSVRPLIIRPVGRDGGARLYVDGRLYDVLHSYDETRLDAQWGRVWK